MIFAFPLPPQIPNFHELPGGFAPPGPPTGLCPGPAGDRQGPQNPRLSKAPPPNVNSWIRA